MRKNANLKYQTEDLPPELPGPVVTANSEPASFIANGSRDYWRANAGLFLSGFATFSLIYCVQPIMPAFSDEFRITPALSSLSLSITTGLLAVAIFCAAAVSERFGRKHLMLVSILGASLCNILCAFVYDYQLLLLIRGFEGLLLGGGPAVAMAYLSEEIDSKGLGATMGLYIAGNALGGMAGRVLTGTIAEFSNWRIAMAGIGLIGIAAAAGFLILLPASRNFVRQAQFSLIYHFKAWGGHLQRPIMVMLFAIGFLVMGTFVTVYNYLGFRLIAEPYALSQTYISLIFMAYIFGVAASWIAGALGDRFGACVVLTAGILTAVAGCALTVSSSLYLIILGTILVTVGFFMSHAIASGLVGRSAIDAKGHASSLYLLAYYLGSSVAGSIGGHFWSEGGWFAVVGFCTALLLLALSASIAVGLLTADRKMM